MSNLRASLTQAAFWHQPICLSCGEVGDDEGEVGPGPLCALCGEPAAVDARLVLAFVENLETEDE